MRPTLSGPGRLLCTAALALSLHLPVLAAPSAAPAATPTVAPRTLYLTIIGGRTWVRWGKVGERPPELRSDFPGGDTPAAAGMSIDDAPDAAIPDPLDDTPATLAGDGPRPLGPAPQQCPATLPAGSGQPEADALRREAGCRYLSSCEVGTGRCTWFYQGRG